MSATPNSQSPVGLLLIDKPRGPTSMDVCRVVKRALIAGGAQKKIKVGHGGTLDPLATGLLVVLVGRATKLCDAVMAGAKSYVADVDLAAFTATDDAEGAREPVTIATPPTREDIDAVLPRFTGTIMQRPPAFSAMKIGGERAYRLARNGRDVEIPPRPVRIDALRVLDYAFPRLVLHIDCGKGTYIRSLARDIGAALGTGGHLAALRRTLIGRWTIDQSHALDALPAQLTRADLLLVPEDLLIGRAS